jgi:hypothetical protein
VGDSAVIEHLLSVIPLYLLAVGLMLADDWWQNRRRQRQER